MSWLLLLFEALGIEGSLEDFKDEAFQISLLEITPGKNIYEKEYQANSAFLKREFPEHYINPYNQNTLDKR